MRQIVSSLDEARHRECLSHVLLPAVNARANLAACHAELGRFPEGHVLGEEGVRIAEAVVHPASLICAYWGVGLLALRQGHLPSVLPSLERAMGMCQDADLSGWFPRIASLVGSAYALAGRVADAVPLLTQALDQTLAEGTAEHQVFYTLSLGEGQVLAGRLKEAQALAEQALALAREHQERGNQAYALRLLGEIAARREPPESDQAEEYYRQALALAEELSMRPLVAHCHLGLGTLYAKIARRELARAALTAAIDLYRAMDMTFWLPQAEAALAQVEGW
jgi:tetratricopeptide (TPR) repeat protein